ncbi:hypothetical protein K491DRAFT_696309 [Lophiostoma macrostomum CBS 122681]|uniref:Uncharacterized protein n=1 Tax=Lophiostoma macrostomum CBS 122681 TaxID=1314788 RepID=A0A6A6SZE3_9PLEO|nr:hypothetical protein K491DRAFT_696309 [Lophiostoma macrostomum CBS 122681]
MPIPSLTSALRTRTQTHSKPKSSRLTPPDPSIRENASQSYARIPQSVAGPQTSHVDGTKRRSFLPQPGDSKHYTRRNGVDDASVGSKGQESNYSAIEMPDAKPMKPVQMRPRSLYQGSSSGAREVPEKGSDHNAQGLPSASGRKPDLVPLGLSRSSSLRKPMGSMQAPQVPNLRTHVRTKSTTIAPGARDVPMDNRTYNGRPKSLLAAPSASVRNALNSSANHDARDSASSARNIALKRSVSTRARSAASETEEHGAPGQDMYSTQHAPPTYPTRREPVKEEQKKQARPAFSTLQQHFTPRKVGKAPTSTFLHPPVQETGISFISSEVSSLQAEILQLHLLHRSSTETNRRWESSAKRSLSVKFDEVSSMYQVMREEERKSQEQKNIRALRDWGGTDSSFALTEHIHILCGPLHELSSVADPNGRFSHLSAAFTRWIGQVEDVWAAREADSSREGGDLRSAEGLGDVWKVESAALTRRLTTLLRDLDGLTQPVPGSSVACIISTSRQFLSGTLDELLTMQAIEADIVDKEREWVEACLRAIARDMGRYSEIDEGKEAWRR